MRNGLGLAPASHLKLARRASRLLGQSLRAAQNGLRHRRCGDIVDEVLDAAHALGVFQAHVESASVRGKRPRRMGTGRGTAGAVQRLQRLAQSISSCREPPKAW